MFVTLTCFHDVEGRILAPIITYLPPVLSVTICEGVFIKFRVSKLSINLYIFQQEVIQESKVMVPDTKNRLIRAQEELQKMIVSLGEQSCITRKPVFGVSDQA